MLISHRHEFLYFVIPKCGSATLRKSLAAHADLGWPVKNYEQHLPIHRFLQTPEADLFDRYFKFTFTRNPYDRIYSGYLQDRHASENYPRWTKEKKPIFDEIGDDFSAYLRDYASKADIHSDWRWICFCPMVDFAFKDGECMMDFVGHAEDLEGGINKLAERLSINIDKAPDENVRTSICTSQPKYLEHYDDEALRLVNTIYAEDFERFGYLKIGV